MDDLERLTLVAPRAHALRHALAMMAVDVTPESPLGKALAEWARFEHEKAEAIAAAASRQQPGITLRVEGEAKVLLALCRAQALEEAAREAVTLAAQRRAEAAGHDRYSREFLGLDDSADALDEAAQRIRALKDKAP